MKEGLTSGSSFGGPVVGGGTLFWVWLQGHAQTLGTYLGDPYAATVSGGCRIVCLTCECRGLRPSLCGVADGGYPR